MATITQDMRYRLSLLKYAEKFGVTKAAIKYKTNRQYIYRWKRRYDGSMESLRDRSRRPHHHPNQHTPEEIKLISDMRRRNPDAGLIVFWVKLMQRGYTRSIPGLYRFLRKQKLMPAKPANPKYVPKPYETMDYPGQRIQVDVKFVPAVCLVNEAKGLHFYQYTAIDEFSRWRFVEAFEEHSTYSSALFVDHLVKAFPCPIECIQTDNGPEFTNRFTTFRNKPTLFQMHLEDHFMDGKLHIIFYFKGGKYQIVSVVCKIIRCSANLLIQIHDPVRHIADMHDMIIVLFKIIAVKIHGTAFI